MISAILVNHDGEALIERCLQSLGTIGEDLEVLVVDNASTDRSIEIITTRFPEARILAQDQNLGFGAANNLAAAEASGESLLLLNVDAWLEPGALELFEARMNENPRIGMVAPNLYYPDGGRQFVWSPTRGVAGEALQVFRNPFEGRAWAHGSLARFASRLVGRVWYTAACVLIRTEAFREIGGFDESFFMYFEDVDLCIRMETAGWKLDHDPDISVIHQGGFASKKGVDEIYRPSQLRFYALHRPRWEAAYIERRLRRRYGNTAVENWCSGMTEE